MGELDSTNLRGKKAIVTGATKGVGRSIAKTLIAHGCHVHLCARNADQVASTVQALATSQTNVGGQACDVGNQAEVESFFHGAVEALEGLDILVNNAGIGIFAKVQEMSPPQWRTVMSTNLDSLFYCCHNALPIMKAGGGGFIINIGSLAGKHAVPTGAAYCASKFALVGFSEALMQEVRHDDIRVAYIMPGSIDTGFGGPPQSSNTSWKLSAQDVADVVIDTLSRSPKCLTSRIEMRPSRPPQK
jgi:NAD(P)-dependent dehydrogenase (short-subunit alcohol dehydrogenase family)